MIVVASKIRKKEEVTSLRVVAVLELFALMLCVVFVCVEFTNLVCYWTHSLHRPTPLSGLLASLFH